MSKVLFVGAGNMGRAIIEGVLKKGSFTKSDLFFYEVNEDTASNIEKEFGIERILRLDERVKDASIIILAVKPQTFKNFIDDKEALNLRGFITERQTVVSIMAGISIQKIEDFFGKGIPVIRVMPNTAALVGLSATAMSFSKSVSPDNLERVKEVFLAVGIVEVVDEKLIDAVTGLSGSGPAYVFMFIESLTQGGILCGLPKSVAEKLAIQTVLGASFMAGKETAIEDLRHMVTSPGGTTIEGVRILEQNAFRSAIIEAVKAASERSKELGKSN